MARTVEFEDMDPRDWPADLRALRSATESAYDAVIFIDAAMEPHTNWNERAPLLALWQAAFKLYKALQTVGLARLAEVEGEA